MKSHYDLFGVHQDASTEEIKRAFRHEISRYHPDKVQHLGQEFQDLAADRAAELTRAYQVLMNEASRAQYDRDLRSAAAETPPLAQDAPPVARGPATPPGEPPPPPGASAARASDQFVRRAALLRFRQALERSLGDVESVPLSGFDLSVLHRPKRGVFRKGDAAVRLLARFVPAVDAAAIDESWPLALRAKPSIEAPVYLFLLGVGLADKEELAHAVDVNRRRFRGRCNGLLPVLVDVRTWEALIPTGAPAVVRALIAQLRTAET